MTITTPQIPRYPDNWPVPQRDSHRGVIDAGLVRSKQQGFPQQYRFTPTAPTRLVMVFRIPSADWVNWLTWINTYAITRWCLLPCIDQHQNVDPTPTYDWSIARFTGRIRTTFVGEGHIDAQCEVDVWPQDIGVAKPGTDWPAPIGGALPQCQPYACDSFEDWLTGEFNIVGGFSPRFGVSYATVDEPVIGWPFPTDPAPGVWVWATIGGDYDIVSDYSPISSIRAQNINPTVEQWQLCASNELTQHALVNAGAPFVVESDSWGPMSGAFLVMRYFDTSPADKRVTFIVLGTTHFQCEMWSIFLPNPIAGLTRRADIRYHAGVYLFANSLSDDLEVRLYHDSPADQSRDPSPLVLATLSAAQYIDGKFSLVSFSLTPRLGDLYVDGAFMRAPVLVDYSVVIGSETQGLSPLELEGTYSLGTIGSSGAPNYGDHEARMVQPESGQARNVFFARTGPSSDGWTPGNAPANSGIDYPLVLGDTPFFMAFASIDGRLGADSDATIRIPWLRNHSSYVLPPECS